jgi:ribosomal protein S18 acetylase RimI-like enzyme
MSGMAMTIIPATTTAEVVHARALFLEYAAESKLDLCFQGFEEELATLPGKYAPPSGRLLLARDGEKTAGCGALRELSEGVCEMKRLFVRPAFRKQGAGRLLAARLVEEARRIGYKAMRLDTLASMHAALALYESLGFRLIPAYYANPLAEVVYLELAL